MHSQRQSKSSTVRTETYYSARSFAISVVSTSSAIYYPARSSLGKVNSATGQQTYVKWHRDQYKQVYRLPPPECGPVTRDYVLKHLPKLNLSDSIATSGDGPVAMNGGFANVYMGNLFGEFVAIKVMRTSSNKEELEKVEKASLRELFTWSQLTHENILDLLGYTFNHPPCVAFVSPWQENGNATDYLQGKDLSVARKVLGGAVEGLQYLHGKDIVHGDFRGNNILINEEGKALVADFGFAKILELAGFSSGSAPGGNVRWMAPELFGEAIEEGNACTHSKESDMWSLGMTILELCSSEKPYHDIQRDGAVLIKLLQGALPNRHSSVPDFLWNICNELWWIEPSGRLTVADTRALLSAECNIALGQVDEMLREFLRSATSRVSTVVVREVFLGYSFDINKWRALVPVALNVVCASGGGTFYAHFLRYLVELDIIGINGVDDLGHTSLHHVAQFPSNQSLSSIAALLTHPGANLNATDRFCRTPLHYAVIRRHDAMVKALLEQPDVNVNIEDAYGLTPIWYAFVEGSNDYAARTLLLHPAIDVNGTDSEGRTLLHYALKSTREVVQTLLQHEGPNVNAKDAEGRTPLCHAASCLCDNQIEELLKRPDIDINSADKLGRTPLHYAVIHSEQRNHEQVSLLLRLKNMQVNAKDFSGRTALSYAVKYPKAEALVCLLKHPKIDVNSTDSFGQTSLHHAMLGKNHIPILMLLKFPSINIRIKNQEGQTPFYYAAKQLGDGMTHFYFKMWREFHPDEGLDLSVDSIVDIADRKTE